MNDHKPKRFSRVFIFFFNRKIGPKQFPIDQIHDTISHRACDRQPQKFKTKNKCENTVHFPLGYMNVSEKIVIEIRNCKRRNATAQSVRFRVTNISGSSVFAISVSFKCGNMDLILFVAVSLLLFVLLFFFFLLSNRATANFQRDHFDFYLFLISLLMLLFSCFCLFCCSGSSIIIIIGILLFQAIDKSARSFLLSSRWYSVLLVESKNKNDKMYDIEYHLQKAMPPPPEQAIMEASQPNSVHYTAQ